MRLPPVHSKTVLITGCSSGIGLATARLMKEAGWSVIPTVRKPEHMDRLRAEGFAPVALDVADANNIEQAVADAMRAFHGNLGAVVNNAGFGQPGAIEDLTREAMQYQFEVNLFGLQDLTNRLIPVFRRQGFGRIVNVSSVVGRVSLPLMGIYSASKFALEAVSDAMRVELRGSGVGVSLIEPGPIATEFPRTARVHGIQHLEARNSVFEKYYLAQMKEDGQRRRWTDLFRSPPAAVARKIRHALESPWPRRRYPVTLPAYLGAWAARYLPTSWLDAMIARRGR